MNKTNTTGSGGMDNDKSEFDDTGNLDAYHRELEVERTRKREKGKRRVGAVERESGGGKSFERSSGEEVTAEKQKLSTEE